MKAAPFEYVRAETLEHALEVLSLYGAEGKLLAGGQSLVPMMVMRLARPTALIDINRLKSLKQIDIQADRVVMGAASRQRDVEDDRALLAAVPLLGCALTWIGHSQTRNRGTVGGSLVHADPSAELPLAAVVLEAQLSLRTYGGSVRDIAAGDFFVGPMSTATGDTECLTEISWPRWQGERLVSAFEEVAMRHGDFAMAAACAQLQFDESGLCTRAAIGLGGVDGVPLAFPALAAQLIGRRIDSDLAREVAHEAASQCQPGTDVHADAAYRRQIAAVLLTRVLLRAPLHNQASHEDALAA